MDKGKDYLVCTWRECILIKILGTKCYLCEFEQTEPIHCSTMKEENWIFVISLKLWLLASLFQCPSHSHYLHVHAVPQRAHNLSPLPNFPFTLPSPRVAESLVSHKWWICNGGLSGQWQSMGLGTEILLDVSWSYELIYRWLMTSNTRRAQQKNF